MTEHHPEETMAIVASDLDRDELPEELIDGLVAGAHAGADHRFLTGCSRG